MPLRLGYCQPEDVAYLCGKIPIARGVSLESVVATAADEMDSAIGRRYEIPVVVDSGIKEQRADALYLKSLNAQLGAGRLITSIAAGAEFDEMHAYGNRLLAIVSKALKDIEEGRKDLISGILNTTEQGSISHPILISKDRQSMVDAFYDTYEPSIVPGRMEAKGWQTFP